MWQKPESLPSELGLGAVVGSGVDSGTGVADAGGFVGGSSGASAVGSGASVGGGTGAAVACIDPSVGAGTGEIALTAASQHNGGRWRMDEVRMVKCTYQPTGAYHQP